jgi:hypothetical protein
VILVISPLIPRGLASPIPHANPKGIEERDERGRRRNHKRKRRKGRVRKRSSSFVVLSSFGRPLHGFKMEDDR